MLKPRSEVEHDRAVRNESEDGGEEIDKERKREDEGEGGFGEGGQQSGEVQEFTREIYLAHDD